MSIDQAIIEAGLADHRAGAGLSALQAKVIANAWHGGQSSALYAFTSTGAILPTADDEIAAQLHHTTNAQNRAELEALAFYVRDHGERGKVHGWSDLTW
jgi:hypothetical protein